MGGTWNYFVDIEYVRKAFQPEYDGPDIVILWPDDSDSLVFENGYTLEDCEKAYLNGAEFFLDI